MSRNLEKYISIVYNIFDNVDQDSVGCDALTDAVVMNYTIEVSPAKALLSMLPCFIFLYVNVVMLFALLRTPLLLESPRYVLFGHLLLTDSLQLLLSMLFYLFAVAMLRMITYACVIVTLVAATTVKMSPLILAVMCLERYVAICFPLRHADIATIRKTGVAVAIMWTVASLDAFTQFFLFVTVENTGFTMAALCHRHIVLQLQIYSTITKAFTIVYFVSVSSIIIYTYVAIMITVKSSAVRNDSKAHKTVLLHLLQLCLCLTSTLFHMLNSGSMSNKDPTVGLRIQYALFLGLLIFPKCLSPLIYGLRDNTFRHVFIYYFTFGFKTTVHTSPKS